MKQGTPAAGREEPDRPAGREDSDRPGESRAPLRRASRAGSLAPVLAAVIVLLLAVELVHHLPGAKGPTLSVTASGARQLVSLKAPAGSTVGLSIFAQSDAHAVRLAATGSEQHFQVPAAWSQAPWITVSGCLVNRSDQCQGPSVTADDRPAG